ncbi:MAG: DNA/RNA nuclease SfsA [bacterium]|nr:MAG: DNA/RNA nuclease SfsA [bacterium]
MTLIHTYGTLQSGILVRRYKRFLADVLLDDGSAVTAFTPNSGSMKTCSDPGSPVMLVHDPKPGRKTHYNLEMVKSGDTWVGVNTGLANRLAAGIIDGDLTGDPRLEGFRVERPEVVWQDSRFDLKVSRGEVGGFVEVKNVTYRSGEMALFPDAVTTRGQKHLETLIRAAADRCTACNLFVVQRSDCAAFTPARDIDPVYAHTCARARESGVIMIACLLEVSPEGIWFKGVLPIL